MKESGWMTSEVLQQGLAWMAGSSLAGGQQALACPRLSEGSLAFVGLRWRSEAAFLGSWGLVFDEVAAELVANSLEGFSCRCPTVWADIERAERGLRVREDNGGRP